MKALIVATGDHTRPGGAGERPPGFLLPLIDRPFLQHIVEFVAEADVVDAIDIVLNQLPERVEALLGDGTRWGIQVRYHLARDAARPYAALSRLATDGPVLLIHADCLPQIPLKNIAANPMPIAFCADGLWTGWALLDCAAISAIEGGWDRTQLSLFVTDAAGNRGLLHDCPIVLRVRCEAEFIVSQRDALDKRFPGLMFYGREVEEGVWIARNVTIHPTVKLVPPVYLGENSRIGAGVLLGPNVVVVRDSVLDCGTTAIDSTILPGSYVGQALELDHVIIDRNRLVNIRAGGESIVCDDFILSGITRPPFRSVFADQLSRTAALVLFSFTWPIVLLTALVLRLFRQGPVVHPVEAICLPAAQDRWAWKTFQLNSFSAAGSSVSPLGHLLLRFLPGLINVIRGDLHLVGVAPRGPEAVLALSDDWRILYLRAHAGLVTEAFALHGYAASGDDVYTSEAYYSVAAGPIHDAKVLIRYFGRIFQTRQTERRSPATRVNLDLK